MRHEAQKSIAYQDMLPADAALCGFRSVSAESFLAALRVWEKRRGIAPGFVKSTAKVAPTLPKEAKPKKTREEKLARKRELARKRWATMTPEQKAAETARIARWRNEKENKQK